MAKKRTKRKRRKRTAAQNARRRIEKREPRASDYIYHLPEIIEVVPNFPLLLCCRVSTREQANDGNLERQSIRLRKAVEDMGAENIVCDEIIQDISLGKVSRVGLECMIAVAEGFGAIPVFETADRIIRAKDFCPKRNPSAIPAIEDFEELMQIANGVPLATVVHPDADYIEIKRYQSKYKDKVLFNKSKSGWTIRRRKKYLPIVLRLRAKGASYAAIAKQLNLSAEIVRLWSHKYSD